MIHLYDVNRGLELIESLDDHSAAVVVRFSVAVLIGKPLMISRQLRLLTVFSNRSLVFRDVAITDTGYKISRCHHQIASHGTVYDMAIDPSMEVAVTVGQDKKINAFSISAGKLIKTFKQDGSFGEPIKVALDPSSSYLVCSYSNKSMCIYDFTNGELVTQAVGHGEVITGVIFLPDCKHIISVGGDGCIFVWRLPAILSSRMLQTMMEHAGPLTPTSTRKPLILSGNILYDEIGYQCNADSNYISKGGNCNKDGEIVVPQELGSQHASAFKFSISRLPKWAQAKVTSEETVPLHLESILDQHVEPELVSSLMNNDGGIPAPEGPVDVQSPTHHDLGADELCLTNTSKGSFGTDASESSPLPQEFSSTRHIIEYFCNFSLTA
ncbi:WD40 repeat [Macleaya cordata]|uniref:WD40 repeat n=1 Tax=Macleaya cordata TaxID=56857 RepID=A0A200QFE8_MACCD|nr:WD40 repeat [Macleaya cordata]